MMHLLLVSLVHPRLWLLKKIRNQMLDLYSLELKEAKFNNFGRFIRMVLPLFCRTQGHLKVMKFVYNCPMINHIQKAL
jgi:hypothetical protein